ncbi:MAG: M24 family metallopeptidase [Nanobdellota archaeon]
MEEKTRKLKKIIEDKKLDLIILPEVENSGIKISKYLIGKELSFCFVFIKKDKGEILISPLEYDYLKTNNAINKFRNSKYWKIKKAGHNFLEDSFVKKTKKQKLTIGIPNSKVTKKLYDNLRKKIKKISAKPITTKDISNEYNTIRSQKTSEEIKKIKKAVLITENIFSSLFEELKKKKFKYENEIVKYLKIKALENNCSHSFEPVVASGSNSSKIHYFPENQKLKKGFCIIDFGVEYKGYCSDMTRTIYLGKPSSEQKKLYGNLRALKSKLIDSLFDKKTNLAETFKNHSYNNLYNASLKHALGHGIGLDVHESPVINNNEGNFPENFVFAFEPAIYFTKEEIIGKQFKKPFGIRIEDDYYIKNGRVKKLGNMDDNLKIFPNLHIK